MKVGDQIKTFRVPAVASSDGTGACFRMQRFPSASLTSCIAPGMNDFCAPIHTALRVSRRYLSLYLIYGAGENPPVFLVLREQAGAPGGT